MVISGHTKENHKEEKDFYQHDQKKVMNELQKRS